MANNITGMRETRVATCYSCRKTIAVVHIGWSEEGKKTTPSVYIHTERRLFGDKKIIAIAGV